jgi:hypothetical protein
MISCKQCGHANPEGTTFCQNPDCGAFLEWTGEHVQTGATPTVGLRQEEGRARVTLSMTGTELRAEPGGAVTVDVQVASKGRVVDQITVRVSGEAGRWATVQPDVVNLLPGTDDVARITFAPPRTETAGTKQFRVEAVSREDPAARATADGTLTVGVYQELTAKLVPRTAEARSRTTYQLVLENRGNTAARVALRAEDENAALAFALQPEVVTVGPRQDASAAVTVTGTRRRRVGPPETHLFHVHVQPDGGSPFSVDGTFVLQGVDEKVTKSRLLALRVVLTLLGGLLMIGGAQMAWLEGIPGVDLTYDQYAGAAFDANVEEPPDDLPTVLASVGLPAIVLGSLAMLGLVGKKGRLTRFAALLSLLVFIAFAVTLSRADFSVGGGVIVVILGAALAFVGGLLANR